MSRFVEWEGKLWGRGFFDPPLDLPPGACGWCGDLGVIPEQIDEERFDVAVPCPHCRMFCRPCNAWVVRRDHRCKEKP
jgi:hypothetical protein